MAGKESEANMWFLKKGKESASQVERIKMKLKQASRKDSKHKIFGASLHKYKIQEPIPYAKLVEWQTENKVVLPESYARFLTEIGNGGAGPYYGMYSLEKATSYTESDAMNMQCVLYPNMDKEEWNRLTEPLNSDEDISDSEYDAAHNKVLGGMLCIGTQGCEYDMYLVLEGEHTGKVVYTSDFHPNIPFFFVYEDNFLNWYERWLDEIILDYELGWFGSRMPGDEDTLIKVYRHAPDEETRIKALEGLFKIKQLTPSTIKFLKGVADKEHPAHLIATRLICKTSIERGSDYLLRWLEDGEEEKYLQALMILKSYGKEKSIKPFVEVIKRNIKIVEKIETVRFVAYVLETACAINLEIFAPFLKHSDYKIQSAAIYATSSCPNKAVSWQLIAQMFKDGGEKTILETLKYWDAVPHVNLLSYYKLIWQKSKPGDWNRDKLLDCLKRLGMSNDYFDRESTIIPRWNE